MRFCGEERVGENGVTGCMGCMGMGCMGMGCSGCMGCKKVSKDNGGARVDGVPHNVPFGVRETEEVALESSSDDTEEAEVVHILD